MKEHITLQARSESLNLHRIRIIRNYLDHDTCRTIVQALVISHLDYANAILMGLPACDINTLQRVQNRAAKLVLRESKFAGAKVCLKSLHWLPINQRIKHKVLSLVFKSLNGDAPQYLKNLLREAPKSKYRLQITDFHKIKKSH
ncbi:hypothetical protein HOLleu_31207 [Holothuria leucospilota]|uniref:Uncharacterized protein n=1 Tax=Holothuria leucospilota TaxID=206669 RepID=A0A9Q1BHN8_HOLLE|nr:hypothetical protein HOLleu_31207 [Holothuria leucospilota]